jgi:hypothetical protein
VILAAFHHPLSVLWGVHDGRNDDERLRDEAVGMALEDAVMHIASVWDGHQDFGPAWLQA